MTTLLKLYGIHGLLRSSLVLWGAYYDRPHSPLVIGQRPMTTYKKHPIKEKFNVF